MECISYIMLCKDPRAEQFRPKTNNKLTAIYEKPDIKKKWLKVDGWDGLEMYTRLSNDQNCLGTESGRTKICCDDVGKWRDNIVADLRAMGIEQNPELMQNREGWRMMMPRLTKSCKTADIETVLI